MTSSSARCAVIAAIVVASCVPEHVGRVAIADPRLVPIAPGVAVIADAAEPVFVAEAAMWLYRSPNWYRSDPRRGGFTRVDYTEVPGWLLAIERPERYARFTRARALVIAGADGRVSP